MSRCILDTDVVSYIFKRDSRAKIYESLAAGFQHSISFVTAAELYRWPLLNGWGAKRTSELELALKNYIIIHSNLKMSKQWAEVSSIKGRQMGYHDAWIAAAALTYNLPLLTNNKKDFEHVPGLILMGS